MKKSILTIFAFGALLTSCSNNGNEAETSEAEDVNIVKTAETVTFKTVEQNSNIEWRASHLGGMQPRYGKLSVSKAEFLVNDNQLTNASVTIDLLSADFFNTEKYPTTTFELTKVVKSNGSYNSTVTGNLTILDVTKSITFEANVNVSDSKISIKSEDFSVDRTNWGLSYNTEGTAGVPADYIIANDIGFTINVTVSK